MFRKLVIIAMVMGMAGMALAVTIGNPTTGNSWSTMKYVSVTASTAINHGDANNTTDGTGMDSSTGLLHGNLWSGNMWYADVANPNTPAAKYNAGITYGGPAWIVYSFDDVYYVSQIKIWNYNECSSWPRVAKSRDGIKNCKIEYSTNGTSWTSYNGGASVTLTQASGKGWDDPCSTSTYKDVTKEPVSSTVSVGGIQAKFIAIIPELGANGNFATSPDDEGAYGLSEVRFVAGMNRATMPDPMISETNVLTSRTLTWVKGDDANIAKHKVYLSTDQTGVTNRSVTGVTVTPASYTPTGLLVAGKTYYWAVDELNASNAVVTGGSGVVWSFSVPFCAPGSEPLPANGNLNSDCYINFKDFAVMCDNWHKSGYWPQ